MASITTRAGKGSPLTHTEVDDNFSNLNNDKLENINSESIEDLSDVASMTPTDGQVLQWNDTNSNWEAADASGGGGLTVYATTDDVPSSGSSGDMAFVTATGRLLVYAGSQWVSVVMANATPTISGNNASYTLATDGTATTVTLSAVDPEGVDTITWSYTTEGLGSTATISRSDNVFTITPSTSIANDGSFSITFRASDGVGIGTSVSEFTLDLFVPEFFPDEDEGYFIDFTDISLMHSDTSRTTALTAAGQSIASIRQKVDLSGSASYVISDPVGDTDGVYTTGVPTLGNDGTRYYADIGIDKAFRLPTVTGDLTNFMFSFVAKNIAPETTNSRLFTMEAPTLTGTVSIGIENTSDGQLFCKVSGTSSNFSVDSTNGIDINSSTAQVVTVIVNAGTATFRADGTDLGNSGSGGPSAAPSLGCVFGGGYQASNYTVDLECYGMFFCYGTFTSTEIDLIEDKLASLAGITI